MSIFLGHKSTPTAAIKDKTKDVITIKKRTCCTSLVGCLIVFIMILLGLIFVLAVGVAKTGLMELPFFSKVFYKIPEPTRLIKVTNEAQTLEENFQGNFEDKMKVALASPGTISLTFTEEELTGLFRHLAEEMDTPESDFRVAGAQIAVLENQLEIFGNIIGKNSTRKAAIIIGLAPQVDEGQIQFEVTSLKIGALSLPTFLMNALFKSLLGGGIENLNDLLAEEINIQGIELAEGQLTVRGGVVLP